MSDQGLGTAGTSHGWSGQTRAIGRVDAAVASPQEAVRWLCESALKSASRGQHVHLINAYSIALADRDHRMNASLSNGAVNFPDGKPLSWVSRLRRDSPPLQQVRGPGLFQRTFDVGRSLNIKHYLLGSTESVLRDLELQIAERYPGAEIVGVESPPFRALTGSERLAQDERIRTSCAQIVWVGLGTPKQDYEAQRLAQALPIVAVAVGAAFDFVSGNLREAPSWVRAVGLEWAFRFVSEPKRLWRRYIFGNLQFIRASFRRRQN